MREDGKLAQNARKVLQLAMRDIPREEVARKAGIKKDTLEHWVGGSGVSGISLRGLQRLCNVLNLTPNDLLLEPEELEVSRRAEALLVAHELLNRLLEQELSDGPVAGDGLANGREPRGPQRASAGETV